MKKKHWRSSEGQKRSCFSQPSGRYAQLYGGGAPTPKTFPRFLTRNTFPLAQHGTKHTKRFFFRCEGGVIDVRPLTSVIPFWSMRELLDPIGEKMGRWEKNEQEFMIGSSPKTGNECFAAGRTCFSVVVEWHFFHPSSSFTAMLFSDMVDPLFLPKSTAPNLSCSILNLSQTVRSGLAIKKSTGGGEKNMLGKRSKKMSNAGSSPMRRDRTGAGSAATLSFDCQLNWIELFQIEYNG